MGGYCTVDADVDAIGLLGGAGSKEEFRSMALALWPNKDTPKVPRLKYPLAGLAPVVAPGTKLALGPMLALVLALGPMALPVPFLLSTAYNSVV